MRLENAAWLVAMLGIGGCSSVVHSADPRLANEMLGACPIGTALERRSGDDCYSAITLWCEDEAGRPHGPWRDRFSSGGHTDSSSGTYEHGVPVGVWHESFGAFDYGPPIRCNTPHFRGVLDDEGLATRAGVVALTRCGGTMEAAPDECGRRTVGTPSCLTSATLSGEMQRGVFVGTVVLSVPNMPDGQLELDVSQLPLSADAPFVTRVRAWEASSEVAVPEGFDDESVADRLLAWTIRPVGLGDCRPPSAPSLRPR